MLGNPNAFRVVAGQHLIYLAVREEPHAKPIPQATSDQLATAINTQITTLTSSSPTKALQLTVQPLRLSTAAPTVNQSSSSFNRRTERRPTFLSLSCRISH